MISALNFHSRAAFFRRDGTYYRVLLGEGQHPINVQAVLGYDSRLLLCWAT